MDSHHFDDYAPFPFDNLPDDDSLLMLSDQSGLQIDPSASQPYGQANPIASGLKSTLSNGPPSISSANAAFEIAPSHRTSSVDRQDDDGLTNTTNEKQTPASAAMEDGNLGDDTTSHRGRADGTDLGGKSKDDKSENTPSWSDLKTKAGKERKRLPLACIACRRKKIRCSGEKPACKHCLRSRVPCVYKVTARKAAPRTDYMAMLDKRLKRMEERIIKVIPKSEQAATVNVPRAVLKPSIPGTSSGSKPTNRKRNAGEAFGGGVEAFLKAPSNNDQVESEKANAQRIKEAEENHLFQEGADALPSKEVQEHLAEVFFENVYGQAYNLLHKPSYMRKLKTNALPPVLVLSVCAIAARFAANPKFHAEERKFLEGEEWASHARAICVRRYEWPNITILTCLLILGLHEFGTCHGGRSWALGGQAIRMAFALQLHKELEHDPSVPGKKAPLSFIDREIRRRIMWACFLMDRFNSSGTDRPMFIREETIQICLPVTERSFQLDMPVPTETLDGKVHPSDLSKDGTQPDLRNNMGVAAYLIRSVALWARIITYLNQGGRDMDPAPLWDKHSGFASLCKDAEEFQDRMPQILRFTTENLGMHDTENTAKQYLLMHITIQQNILFLNRAASMSKRHNGQPPPEEFISETMAKTFDAARRISFLLEEAEKISQFVSAPFAGYCAFTATIVHVMGIRLGNPLAATHTNPNVEVNIRYLNKMLKHWGMFYWMVEHVRNQYKEALDAARSGKTGKDSGVSLLQYGDWFNEYPHGLADSNDMDPANSKKNQKGADGVMEPKGELQSVEEFFTTLSPQNQDKGDAQKGQAPSKRKQTARKHSAATIRTSSGKHVPATSETNSQQVASQISAQLQQKQQQAQQQQQQQQQHSQHQQRQQQQRRFSEAQHGPSNGQPIFNGMSPATAQPGSFNMSPISPVSIQNQFAQQAALGPGPGRTGFFTSEMMMPQQPNPLLQSMEPQMMLDGFNLEANQAMGRQGMMDGHADWSNMQMQPGRIPQYRNTKRDMNESMAPAQNGGERDMMNGFNPQDTSWFMPFNVEPPAPDQEVNMSASDLDAFNGLFNGNGNGMSTPNPLGGLRQGQ